MLCFVLSVSVILPMYSASEFPEVASGLFAGMPGPRASHWRPDYKQTPGISF